MCPHLTQLPVLIPSPLMLLTTFLHHKEPHWPPSLPLHMDFAKSCIPSLHAPNGLPSGEATTTPNPTSPSLVQTQIPPHLTTPSSRSSTPSGTAGGPVLPARQWPAAPPTPVHPLSHNPFPTGPPFPPCSDVWPSPSASFCHYSSPTTPNTHAILETIHPHPNCHEHWWAGRPSLLNRTPSVTVPGRRGGSNQQVLESRGCGGAESASGHQAQGSTRESVMESGVGCG